MIKKLLIACAVLACLASAFASAATVVPGGEVYGNWDEFGSPYLVKEEISVPAGQTLAIGPGVVVDFRGQYKLIVYGTLEAEGTERRPITFTAANTNQGWHGIRFIDASDTSRLTWCIIEHAIVKGSEIEDIEGWGAGIFSQNTSLALSDCIIRECTAVGGSGGGIFLSGSNAEITRCNFTGNQADFLGGALSSYLSDVVIRESGITNNSCDLWGGGVYSEASRTELENCTLLGNESGWEGGALKSSGYYNEPDATELIVRDCTITGNTALRCGGGISADNNNVLEITDCIITGNRALELNGGGVYAYRSSGTIENNLISRNEATSGGGIVITYWSGFELVNNLVTRNTVVEDGGGIWCNANSSLQLRNMTVADNTAQRGGGLFAFNGCFIRSVNTILWGNTSSFGEAAWIGGSLAMPSTLSITHCCLQPGDRSIFLELGNNLEWGPGMTSGDPTFHDPDNGNYRLCQDPCQPGIKNPCVDTGQPLSSMVPGTTRTDCCCDTGIVDMGFHAPIPNSVTAEISCSPESGVLPFTTRVSATIGNALGVGRTMVGQIDLTLANGVCYHNLQPGVIDLGPHESQLINWNQDLPAHERFCGTNTFELYAVDITQAPFNQPPFPMSGDTGKATATLIGRSP